MYRPAGSVSDKKYRLRYGVPFSGSDGVGSSEEIGPGKRGEVLTGKEMRNI